ncbi:MAG: AAA family ATPase [Mariprofundales bacterium]
MKHKQLGSVVVIANQKGGVGKTTTSINLAASLAAMDRRVLLIDIDPQGNATTGLGIEKGNAAEDTSNIYHVLTNECSLSEAIQETNCDNLFLIAASIDLAGIDMELASAVRREQRLLTAMQNYVGEVFSHVIIDCPPALNLLTINSLTAADRVLITLQSEFYAMEGLAQLIETIRHIKRNLNPTLLMDGILLTMVDRRNNLAVQVEEEVRLYFGAQVYNEVIPRNVRLSEAPSYGIPVMYHDVRSTGAQAYLLVAGEMLQREKNLGGILKNDKTT